MFSSLFILVCSLSSNAAVKGADRLQINLDNRETLARALDHHKSPSRLPASLPLKLNGRQGQYKVKYTLDEELQNHADNLLERYKPDYAAIFMMDAKTGKTLVYSSYQKNGAGQDLVKKATYPAASIFKIVTASAAVDKKGLNPRHKIRFNGGNWTLYKKNVLSDKINRWTRTVSLREAFAKSMNTPFGKIGLNNLDPEDLENYAERFMFNQPIPADFEVEKGVAFIPSEKGFRLSEVASGYNKHNRMSPVQGAMIAASVINGGRMVVPYMVENVRDDKGNVVHEGRLLEMGTVMTPASADKVKELMQATISSGTSRKSFFQLLRNKKFDEVEMGGKTGHLTGDNPRGRVDWFVGYASNSDRQIAIGAVTVSKKYWTVKSSHIGQTLFKKAFEEKLAVARR